MPAAGMIVTITVMAKAIIRMLFSQGLTSEDRGEKGQRPRAAGADRGQIIPMNPC